MNIIRFDYVWKYHQNINKNTIRFENRSDYEYKYNLVLEKHRMYSVPII